VHLSAVLIALGALLPSAGVAFLFYLIVKAMVEGDRRERLAHSRWQADLERTGFSGNESDNTGHSDSSL
jgi:hypothetical protein